MCVLSGLCVTGFAQAGDDSVAFRNVAKEAGLETAEGRPQWIDLDGDGWLDLCIQVKAQDGRENVRVFLSTPMESGRRRFVDATEQSGLLLRPDGKPGRQNSFLVWGDFNGDRCLDAVSIVNQTAEDCKKAPQTHAVYLGDGRGHFKAVANSGIERSEPLTTQGAVVCDLDLDGRLDIAFGNSYGDPDHERKAQQMRVYRGLGDGRFRDMTETWGLLTPAESGAANATRPLYGLSAADLDNDGYAEILGAAYGRQWNTLWQRTPERAYYGDFAATYGVDGDPIRHGRYSDDVKNMFRQRFKIEMEDELPFRANGNTFSLAPCDFDGDGDNDLFDASITHCWAGESSDLSALLINQLNKRKTCFFERMLEPLDEPDPQTGLKWQPGLGLTRDHSPQKPNGWNQGDLQAHWEDLDNDGLVDLIVCESDYPHNRLRVWRQKSDHTFVETQREWGIDFPNCPGAALGDFDRDGDIDIAANGTRMRWPEARSQPELSLWENQSPAGNGFLCLLLVGDGKKTNTQAIGARVILTTDRGVQTRELLGSYGHRGSQMQPGEVHFGLGQAQPKSLVVIWPDAKRSETVLDPVPKNAWIVVRQGSKEPTVMTKFDPAKWLKT